MLIVNYRLFWINTLRTVKLIKVLLFLIEYSDIFENISQVFEYKLHFSFPTLLKAVEDFDLKRNVVIKCNWEKCIVK